MTGGSSGLDWPALRVGGGDQQQGRAARRRARWTGRRRRRGKQQQAGAGDPRPTRLASAMACWLASAGGLCSCFSCSLPFLCSLSLSPPPAPAPAPPLSLPLVSALLCLPPSPELPWLIAVPPLAVAAKHALQPHMLHALQGNEQQPSSSRMGAQLVPSRMVDPMQQRRIPQMPEPPNQQQQQLQLQQQPSKPPKQPKTPPQMPQRDDTIVRDELKAAKTRLAMLSEKVKVVSQLQQHMVEQDLLVQKLQKQLSSMQPDREVRVPGSTAHAGMGLCMHRCMHVC
eukprot:9121-Chlamydomonas_euryale.AAC.3